ncbi:MAG: beta strand repeat-containing protein, partial [Bacteroidia bacterium]
YMADGMGAFIAFDDINVSGTASPIYYWDGSGALTAFTSWWTNPNATGANPGSFTFNNQIFNLYPNATNATAATLSSAWTVGGTGTKLNVGDGTTGFNFNVNAVLTIFTGGQLVALNNGTLTLQNTTFPAVSFVTLNSGSTVDYNQSSAVNIWATTYSNLTISGGADKNQSGNPIVSGQLNLNGRNLVMTNSTLQNLTLNGTITGSGLILTGNSKLTIGGTGAFGTISFGTGSTVKTVNQLVVNRGSAGLITLGTDLTSTSTANLSNGTIALNGKNLTLNGAVTFPSSTANGAFTGSQTSSLTIGGSGTISNNLLFDQTSASTRAMKSVVLNRSGATLNLGNALEIWGDLTPTSGAVTGGSNLTLKSDASHKGRIGIVGASGSFAGSPTVELYKSAGLTGWTNLCSSGVNGNSISNWNASFAITCSANCPDGATVSNVAFTSMYTYDETAFIGDDANSAHYIDIGTTGGTAQSLNSKTGYWVYLGTGFPNTGTIIIPLTGAVNTKASSGGFNLTLSAGAPAATDGWNLIANPYPSPISVTNLLNAIGSQSTSIDNTFYAYDPDANNNTPLPAGSIIPMGQAFAVRSLVPSITITPDETWKTATDDNTEIFKTTSASTYYWNDFLIDLTSATTFTNPFFSQVYFNFAPTNTNGFDNGKDAFYLASSVDPSTPHIFSTFAGNNYLRNGLPSINGTVIIPLTVVTGTAYAGVYSLNPVNISKLPAGACVNLYDIANNVTHNLRTGAYTTTISANATTPQFELRITLTPSSLSSNVNNPLCSKGTNGSIIAKGTSAGPWNYTWKDASNNVVKSTIASAAPDTLKNIGVGTYYVDVNTVATCDNANATFSLISTAALPVSGFTVNKDTLNINGTVQFQFSNTSVNANSYTWLFGDGNTANTPTAAHMYANAGNYTVTLIAVNSACGDSSRFNYKVTAVNGATVQSVATIAGADNDIRISKDANGVFVQLNYDKSTKATVSISNILGQVLMSPRMIEGTTDRFYFDVNTAKEQLLLITVTTSDKRMTKRIYND